MADKLLTAEESERVLKRIDGKRWTIAVCAEPDGENCVSGTHPNICRHECAALKRFHESEGKDPGPRIAEVEVKWVGEDGL